VPANDANGSKIRQSFFASIRVIRGPIKSSPRPGASQKRHYIPKSELFAIQLNPSCVGVTNCQLCAMKTVYCRLPSQPKLSLARIVKVKLPTVVGIPERIPSGERVSPFGRLPLRTVKL
jgi:hypothetical protein